MEEHIVRLQELIWWLVVKLITQRFDLPAEHGDGTVEVDVECQNRFTFLVEKVNGEWKAACECLAGSDQSFLRLNEF